MEDTLRKCEKKDRKHLHVIHDSSDISSDSDLSSSSETYFPPFKCIGKSRRSASHSKHDYLSRLFEKKKLKEKSLSKKMKTPFDRKINRTCWPIELKKVSRIKKKPHEKRKEKPSHKSLTRKKFSTTTFISFGNLKCPQVTVSDLEFLDDDSFNDVYQYINKNNYLFEQITPQKLMDVLQDPENLPSGVTIDMIIAKLKRKAEVFKKLFHLITCPLSDIKVAETPSDLGLAFRSTGTLNINLNPSMDQLREEIKQKLQCAIKLGLVIENNGYYRMANNFQNKKLSERTANALWDLWYKKMTKIRN